VNTSLPFRVHGFLAHKKIPIPPGLPQDPRHKPTVGSQGVLFSYERGTPVLQKCAHTADFEGGLNNQRRDLD